VTLREMMAFAGGVLGPALLAQAAAEALRAVPGASKETGRRSPEEAETLLRRAFPDGLPL
jgi:hypothetical protein